MEQFYGKWNTDRSRDEGVREYLKASGAPDAIIDHMLQGDTLFELTPKGDKYELKVTEQTGSPQVFLFRLGEEFELKSEHGLNLRALFNLDGNKLKEKYQMPNNAGSFDVVREIKGGDMVAVTSSKAASMTRYFVRV